ncbi:methionine synthase [filamentous cyanobacterium LEGE 11480]|uniref:Methionine synthase n=1 Tax=Romeriopsis navalis LEGE 11480 TaxID=2777977 RepID=A0A928VJD5_9CYAN|nr:Npun_R2821/Npun_R2822 family protein [Romeriopsis navalis]MBE9029415.1 methionine synthase [Romeriopsis navalis LEGE 11480]
MKTFGIYTLGNDGVYDQVIALLNSIERNVGQDIPVCIIPFDNRMQKLEKAIADRPQVTIFDNAASIARWDRFAEEVWAAHSQSAAVNFRSVPKWYKQCQLLRKMSAFDGEFEQFVFYDADSLAMQPLDDVIAKLQTHDFVFDDWEHQKQTDVAALKFDLIEAELGLSEAEVRPQIHCSSFFGGHRDYFSPRVLRELKQRLVEDDEINWINDLAFWCDADLFSYITLRLEATVWNYTLSPVGRDRTGNTAEARYVNRDQVLYNEEGVKPIRRLHYITHSAARFRQLCRGEVVELPQQELFLYYRFLHEPERCPKVFRVPSWVQLRSRSMSSKVKKLQQLIA